MLQGRLPSEVVSSRRQYLNSLKAFVETHEKKFAEKLLELGMSDEDLEKVEIKKVCPYNKDHIVPEKVYNKHVEKCRLLHAGFQKDELESQLQNLDFFYKEHDAIMNVQLDESLLNKVIWDHCVQTGQVYTGHRALPVSHIDENTQLTQDDRLAVYRHVVSTSHAAGKVIPWDREDQLLTTNWGQLVKKGLLNDENNEFSSKLEQLAALRDLKRRRQSYRAKNVHITKKSYTEIIREVIVNQMEVLRPPEDERISVEDLPDEKNDNQEDRRKRQNEDRDRHRDYRPRSRDRERDRDRYRDRNRDRDRDLDRDRDRTRDRDRDRDRDRQRDRNRGSDKYRSRDRDRDSKKERDLDVERNRDRAYKSKYIDIEEDYDNKDKIQISGAYSETPVKIETSLNETAVNKTAVTCTNLNITVKQEELSDGEISNKSEDKEDEGRRKRRYSISSSESSLDEKEGYSHKKSSKHKKSKHKKKSSKKKKRRSRS